LSVLGLADVHLTRGCSLAMLVTVPPSGNPAGRALRHEVGEIARTVLGVLTRRAPQSLRFEASPSGKPYLAGNDSIAFNLSHSRSYSMIALSLGGEIGCDVEDRFRDDDDVDELGAVVLHPVEQQEMLHLAAPQRREAFKRYWVRKEAALKAAGSGFLKDPRTVIVGLDRAQPVWDNADGPAMNIHERQLGPDCFAAVASSDAACSWYSLAT
jgi:4'-phosphopantetheinyl transferase